MNGVTRIRQPIRRLLNLEERAFYITFSIILIYATTALLPRLQAAVTGDPVNIHQLIVRLSIPASLCFCAAILTGCGVSNLATIAAVPTTVTQLRGNVQGGQQPVSNSSIQLYVASLNGNGSTATPLLLVPTVTDASGSFNVTGNYTCPTTPSLVYLVATGGNPGLAAGTQNSSLVLMTTLGLCSNLSAATSVTINEVTTVAAAWALAPFMTSASQVGASATNFAGLQNAFNTSALLADTTNGSSPSRTIGANVTIESGKVYALANAIASCVNSDGGILCTNLYSAIGTSARNTLTAALAVTTSPARNVAAVYSVIAATAPFYSSMAAPPSDWSMSITIAQGGLHYPTAIGVNSTGQVWAAGYFGVLSEFSAQGVPAFANGITGSGLYENYGLTIDPADNVWVSNEESPYPVNTSYGSVSSFTSSGQPRSGAGGFAAGNIYFPYAVASNSTGSVWVADYGHSLSSLLATDGTPTSGSAGFGGTSLAFPAAVATDTDGSAWFANEGSSTVTHLGLDGSLLAKITCCGSPTGIALDLQGNIWATNYFNNSISHILHNGTVVSTGYTAGGIRAPQGITSDGNGTMWVANFHGSTISELAGTLNPAGAGTNLGPPMGYGADTSLIEPFSVAVDASGTVWVSSYGNHQLVGFVGIGSPVKTPRTGPPVAP